MQVTYGGADAVRSNEEIDAEQFVGVKGIKAKGKRLTTWEVKKIEELEPLRFPEEESARNNDENDDETNDNGALKGTASNHENLDPDAGKSQQQVIDEITGQLRLFNNTTDNETK